MRGVSLLISFIIVTSTAMAQRVHIGMFGGAAAYTGDLVSAIFPKKVTHGAIGITVNYELNDLLMLRTGVTYSVIGGADRYSKTSTRSRNLSFETSITELSVLGEFYLLNFYYKSFSPYIFGGLALFKFNPYAYGNRGEKIYLKPLSTEGQGISGYPDRKPYNLLQLAIPIGGGLKFEVAENLRIGIDGGLRILFTDYLDDVSRDYIDPADLLAAKGQVAVDMSYRSDEVPAGNLNYPAKGDKRGSPTFKDFYYFVGLHLTYHLGTGDNSLMGRKNRTNCPVNLY